MPEDASSRAAQEPSAKRRRAWLGLALVFVLGIVIFLPAIRSPFLLDDYLQASMMEGTFPAKRGPFDLYDFINETDRSVLIERGMLPWWSHPELKIRFFRPLSSALRWGEHLLVGNHPIALHLHSLLWWAAAVLAARALFRRALSPRATWIATIIFALAPCHAVPLTWLANREALLSLVFGLAGLGAYVRFREGGRLGLAALATLLFSLALLCGEYALAFAGYVLAFEIVKRGEPLLRRALCPLVFAAPAAGYMLVRAKLGYGTCGSGFYTDPFRETGAFLSAAPRRFVTLLAEGWFSLDDTTLSHETPGWLLGLLVLIALPMILIPMRRAFAELEEGRREQVGWMLLGSFFALLPVLAVTPSPRVLGASMFGMAPALGLLLDHAWFPATPGRKASEFVGFVAVLLGFAHLVHGPATAWLTARSLRKTAVDFERESAKLRRELASTQEAEVVMIRSIAGSFFLPFALSEHGRPPLRFRILSQAGHALLLRRDARTIDIRVPADHTLAPTGPRQLFRNAETRFKEGESFELPGVRIAVLEIGPKGPRTVRFVFDQELEATKYRWLVENAKGFEITEPPPPGYGKPFDP